MYKRSETRPIYVGNVQIGGQNKVVIQSMCNTKTKNINETVDQILGLVLQIFILIIKLHLLL